MEQRIIEAQYPIRFREDDAKKLGEHLRNRHSVVLIGMKRVGISNFLRFFLHHTGIAKTYIGDKEKHLFIPIDLNDLVEREIVPFWTLTLKRIIDASEQKEVGEATQNYLEALFLDAIQSQDLFLTIDSVRKALVKLVDNGIYPTLFFIRFDRMKDSVSHEFFSNLQGLKDASHQKASFVFTSFRSLDYLSPQVFTRPSLAVFSQDMYIKPTQKEDALVVFNTYKSRYKLGLKSSLEKALLDSVDGYVQYLQLAMIFLHEQKKTISTQSELFDALIQDERISLQSEELWESLDSTEQDVLQKISRGQRVDEKEKKKARYLWETGFVVEHNGRRALFSGLFEYYLKQHEKDGLSRSSDFTKKENALFTLLKNSFGEICEREKIVESVWPEVEAFGVTDWAIDRLVARVRAKLKSQKNKYEIQTVKTRGYKLVSS